MSGICEHDMLQRQCPHCELSQALGDVARLEAKVREMEDDHRAMEAVRSTARSDAIVTLIHNGSEWGVVTWDDGAKHVRPLLKALATDGGI